MKCKQLMSIVLLMLLCVLLPLEAFATGAQAVIEPQSDVLYVRVGKSASIHLKVSPRAARSKGVTYESSDETIATVNAHGAVSGHQSGQCEVTITSKYDETVQAKVQVNVIIPAKKIHLTADSETVSVGETVQLYTSFEPAETSIQQATYKSANPHIATVDENGVVTGVKAGKVYITATAIDGTKVHTKGTIQVTQPVTGVSFKTPRARVGVNYHGTFTAELEPKNATNHAMTWVSANPDIATVSGDKNSVRVQGKAWGETQITGTTADGGYQVSFMADIGSLKHAVRIKQLKVSDGKPHITLINGSNLEITRIFYEIRGYDSAGNQIPMSSDQSTLHGSYDHTLEPGDRTVHGEFNFIHKLHYPALAYYDLAITGWETDTGYFNRYGETLYSYHLSDANFEWSTSD